MRSAIRSLAIEMALQQRSTGRRIAQLRERAHLTQEAAADKAGVTLRAYQKWEAGGGIQYANLQKLADALGTTVEQITGDAETPNPFQLSDQINGVNEEFRRDVDEIKQRLTNIEQQLAGSDAAIESQLKTQVELLADIKAVVAVLKTVKGVEIVTEPAADEREKPLPTPETHPAPPPPELPEPIAPTAARAPRTRRAKGSERRAS